MALENVDVSLGVALYHIQQAQRESTALKQTLKKGAVDTNALKAELDRTRNERTRWEGGYKTLKAEFDEYKAQSAHSLKSLQSQYDQLNRENEDLWRSKDESIKYRLERAHDLEMHELDRLKTDLAEGLDTVQKEQDTRAKCSICYDKPKDIYFIDGCDHLVICSDCERGMVTKLCPQCAAPYTTCKQLRL